eukprot:scaffold525_cov307-Pavlova_lutheri.AAC.11
MGSWLNHEVNFEGREGNKALPTSPLAPSTNSFAWNGHDGRSSPTSSLLPPRVPNAQIHPAFHKCLEKACLGIPSQDL